VPALDVEGVLRSLARAAELVGKGGERDLRRAAMFMEVTLASVVSHLRQQDVVVTYARISREEAPL
jgi:hypothetical protein